MVCSSVKPKLVIFGSSFQKFPPVFSQASILGSKYVSVKSIALKMTNIFRMMKHRAAFFAFPSRIQ